MRKTLLNALEWICDADKWIRAQTKAPQNVDISLVSVDCRRRWCSILFRRCLSLPKKASQEMFSKLIFCERQKTEKKSNRMRSKCETENTFCLFVCCHLEAAIFFISSFLSALWVEFVEWTSWFRFRSVSNFVIRCRRFSPGIISTCFKSLFSPLNRSSSFHGCHLKSLLWNANQPMIQPIVRHKHVWKSFEPNTNDFSNHFTSWRLFFFFSLASLVSRCWLFFFSASRDYFGNVIFPDEISSVVSDGDCRQRTFCLMRVSHEHGILCTHCDYLHKILSFCEYRWVFDECIRYCWNDFPFRCKQKTRPHQNHIVWKKFLSNENSFCLQFFRCFFDD